MTVEQILQEYELWPFTAKPQLIRYFDQGLNHTTVLLRISGQDVVLKLFSRPMPRAVTYQHWAAKLGLAPKIHFCSRDANYVLMEFLPGGPIKLGDVGEEQLAALGKSLQKLHLSSSVALGIQRGQRFDILAFCEHYLGKNDQRGVPLHHQVLPAVEHFAADKTAWRFCHNDLVVANCFLRGGEVCFIDWEYAALHNPWFDLAALIFYFSLTDEQVRVVLNAYDETFISEIGAPIFYSSQIALLWGDILWHVNKFGEHYWPRLGTKVERLKQLRDQFLQA